METGFSPAASTMLSLLTLASIVLIVGGIAMLRRGDRTKGVLMVICAVVLLGNVLIWTV